MTYLEARTEAAQVLPEIFTTVHPAFTDWIRTKIVVKREDRTWYARAQYESIHLPTESVAWAYSEGWTEIGELDA